MATDNPIELLIKLGVNETESVKNIETQIDTLAKNIKDLDININIDDKAVDSLDKLSKLDLGNLNSFLKKAEDGIEGLGKASAGLGKVGKGAEDLAKGVGKAGEAFGGLGKQATLAGQEASDEMQRIQKSIDITFSHLSDEVKDKLKQSVMSVDGLKQAFKDMDDVKLNLTAENIVNDFGQVEKVVHNATIEYKNMQGQLERAKLTSSEFLDVNGRLVQLWKPVSAEIKVVDDSMKRVGQSTEKALSELRKLETSGKISKEQYKELSNEVRKTTDPRQIEEFNQKLHRTVTQNKENVRILKEQEQTQEKIRKTINEIVRMQGKNPQAFANNPEVSNMLKTLEKIDPTAKGASQAVKEVSDNFDRMKAEATVAGRESMSFMDSFKTAMEKFPVWMAASTAFYGTVRSIRDAITQIIDIDSQMTVLRRVAGNQTDVNRVLEESVELAGRLGNAIADVNEGFIAFARQGFRGDELTKMAEYATLLGNISELSVEDASSILTAGMKAFNIEAENSIRIVDSLNEVDINLSLMLEIA